MIKWASWQKFKNHMIRQPAVSDPSGFPAGLPRPVVQKALTRQQKEAIPKLLMHRLTAGGRTVDELGAKLAGDPAQQGLRSERVWHTKAELDAWVADQLRLPPSLWGPDRKSNDLMTATSNEILKMRKRGDLVDWHGGRRLNVFRLSDPSRRADLPAMSGERGEPRPAVIRILEDIFGYEPPALYKDIPDGKLQIARKRILDDVFGHAKSKKGMVVPRFQKTMDGNTTRDSNLFYDYDDDKRAITLHPKAHSFFRRNNHLLSQALLAEWVLYLEKANHGLPLLASKIMATEMKRSPLTQYRDMFYEKTDACFYCLNSFNKSGMHVDHFIPFSYIYDDNAWNLVLSCAECNLSKSDSLPSVKPYFVELVERNEEYAESMSKMKLSLLQLSARGKNTWKKEMRHHYDICAEYGFDRWGYTRSSDAETPTPL